MYLHITWRGDLSAQTRALGDHEPLDPTDHAMAYADAMGFELDPSEDHIPAGCGDLQVTISENPDPHHPIVWASRDYFLAIEEY